MEKTCINCKRPIKMNTYYERKDGKLEPLYPIMDIFIAYCPRLEDYVLEDCSCTGFKPIIETIQIQYIEEDIP